MKHKETKYQQLRYHVKNQIFEIIEIVNTQFNPCSRLQIWFIVEYIIENI